MDHDDAGGMLANDIRALIVRADDLGLFLVAAKLDEAIIALGEDGEDPPFRRRH